MNPGLWSIPTQSSAYGAAQNKSAQNNTHTIAMSVKQFTKHSLANLLVLYNKTNNQASQVKNIL